MARLVSGSKLSLHDRFRYLGAPLDRRTDVAVWELERWARAHGDGGTPIPPSYEARKVPENTEALHACEDIVKRMTTYLWLAERWPAVYAKGETLRVERQRVNGLIEQALASKALARRCRQCQGKLPVQHRFPICDPCHSSRRRYHDHDGDWY